MPKTFTPLLLVPLVERKSQKRKPLPLAGTDFSEADRKSFMDQIKKGEKNECWEWTGKRNPDGYGYFYKCRHKLLATRLMYLFTHGFVSEKLMMRHSCNNPPCCNPYHLSQGTHKDNYLDMISAGRAVWQREPTPEEKWRRSQPRPELRKNNWTAIQGLYEDGLNQYEIAAKTGICQTSVSWILRQIGVSMGTARGERSASAKLTEKKVLAIRKIKKQHPSTPNRIIGAMFGVTRRCADLIISGKRWTHILP